MERGRSDGAEALGASDTEVEHKPQRQKNGRDMKEVLDEYAQDTRRTTLLDRLEQQLKGTPHVSRLFFGFNLSDDRKTQQAIEKAFQAFLSSKGAEAEALSGVLLLVGQVALQLLEGPTELLFQALDSFAKISSEVVSRDGLAETGTKPALISSLRVLHFTELHGVRACRSWCCCVHNSKSLGASQMQLDDTSCPELVFSVYQKLINVSLKVRENVSGTASQAQLEAGYKKLAEQLPTVDEASNLLGKIAGDFLFSFSEFEKVFIAPFHLVLHSELLWPMPPALVY